jgi:SAM-dependent methyltransferase
MAGLIKDADALGRMMPDGCPVCGGMAFAYGDVLWPQLIDEWQLAPNEATYVNIQQGFACRECSSNLRSMVLADAICAALRHQGTLVDLIASPAGQSLVLLEINGAGDLTPQLRRAPGHRLVAYPEIDIHALPFREGSFDLVVHSDTLEHIADPVHAVAECRRVLRPGGWLTFTAPVVVDRMTRSRAGLPPSFHGSAAERRSDLLVHSEFGADAWVYPVSAGFRSVTVHTRLYPAGIAFAAQK